MRNNEIEVFTELRSIARLLAIGPLEGGQRDKIEKLCAAGFSTGQIARLIGAESKTVSAELINPGKRKRARQKLGPRKS